MIEKVSDTYVVLNDVLDILMTHKDNLADIGKLLIDEHGNEKLPYTGGAPIDDNAYKQAMKLIEMFDDVVDEFETAFRTVCLLLPYVALSSPQDKAPAEQERRENWALF